MKIENVTYFTQRDNRLFPGLTCYSTSTAMTIQYLLDRMGKSKDAIGCPSGEQIEDYITSLAEGPDIKKWMQDQYGKFQAWMFTYSAKREIGEVQDLLFNRLMNPHGYRSEFTYGMAYEVFCNYLENTRIPTPLVGDFPRLLGGRHLCCAIGFNKENNSVIVHDPWGNALTRYKDRNGEGVEYIYNSCFIHGNGHMWCNIISEV